MSLKTGTLLVTDNKSTLAHITSSRASNGYYTQHCYVPANSIIMLISSDIETGADEVLCSKGLIHVYGIEDYRKIAT